jgi:hypothetical protein
MTKTAVGYPDEPSRRAMAVAAFVAVVGGAVAARRFREPIRAAVRLASPALVKPLALMLTRLGL